ncbi:acetyl-CoA synthetase-like protein [Penicillium odoratum]|uniref:acetyl-CoA synthetase-like protein n=1 Tax=Penicillium odoratum TaxID=1167516 RepID=UPI00254834F6|nr:acetyl-CoA synthetase-like protein [Penicillium odoratum]KAJ5753297.1 acetyl-CoA synthetase-like protein [Penicillium odoratum]
MPTLGMYDVLFAAGIVSLQVIQLARTLRISLAAAGVQFSEAALEPLAELACTLVSSSSAAAVTDETAVCRALVEKYTRHLPSPIPNKPNPADKAKGERIPGPIDGLHASWVPQVNLAEPTFGLTADIYDRLAREADRVVHSAWPVNFNLSIASFETYLRGVCHLVDFVVRAHKNVPITLIYSVGTMDHWPTPNEVVPESALEDWSLAGTGTLDPSSPAA